MKLRLGQVLKIWGTFEIAAAFNMVPAFAETIIGEYTFEDCDKSTPTMYAQHCLEYDLTLLGDEKGKIRAIIEVNGD